MTAPRLLGEVLAHARGTVGRSPEQVGEQTGVHGRTIRRLEDGESESPRRTTLQALARFYGLDGDFLIRLASWSSRGLEGPALERKLFEVAASELGSDALDALDADDGHDRAVVVAMRLARPRPARQAANRPLAGEFGRGHMHFLASALSENDAAVGQFTAAEQKELAELVVALAGLDRRRRRLVGALIIELRGAQLTDLTLRRRRDLAADGGAEPLFEQPAAPPRGQALLEDGPAS
jgi:transcriptional regulator with XRE-family HTH domain